MSPGGDLRELVPDPAAVKPDHWDDEEDGVSTSTLRSTLFETQAGSTLTFVQCHVKEWIAPLVPNPHITGLAAEVIAVYV